MATAAVDADLAYLGMEVAGKRGTVVVSDRLETPMGTLHGGAALALAIAAMESVTGLGPTWATGQLVGVARHGDPLDLEVRTLAEGRSTTQVHIVASGPAGLVFQVMGATGSGRADIDDRTVLTMPDVEGPDAYEEGQVPVATELRHRGHFPSLEYRHTGVHDGLCMWVRVRDHVTSRPALLALVVDYLPLSITLESGSSRGGGTSLDNTIRFARRLDTEWVLVDCHTDAVERGYGHGTVHAWSPSGELLAVASQTSMQRPDHRGAERAH